MRIENETAITSIFLHGKCWWSRTNGISEWCAHISINGRFVAVVPAENYSSGWDGRAMTWLMDQLGYKRSGPHASGCGTYQEWGQWLEQNNIHLYSVLEEDVTRTGFRRWENCEPDLTYLEHYKKIAPLFEGRGIVK